MGIDYIINYDCPLKREYGLDRMVQLKKNKNKIEMITRMVLKDDPNKNVEDVSFVTELHTPNGVVQKEMKVGDMKKDVEVFKEKLKVCLKCPVNVKTPISGPEDGFGCFQTINYPIDNMSEFFLLKTAEKIINNPNKNQPAFMIIKFIEDKNITGSGIEKMRKSQMKIPFFQSANAISHTYGKGTNKSIINTNQIWAVLTSPNIPPQFAYALFNFLEEFSEEIMKDERTRQSHTILGLIILNQVLKTAINNKTDVLSY